MSAYCACCDLLSFASAVNILCAEIYSFVYSQLPCRCHPPECVPLDEQKQHEQRECRGPMHFTQLQPGQKFGQRHQSLEMMRALYSADTCKLDESCLEKVAECTKANFEGQFLSDHQAVIVVVQCQYSTPPSKVAFVVNDKRSALVSRDETSSFSKRRDVCMEGQFIVKAFPPNSQALSRPRKAAPIGSLLHTYSVASCYVTFLPA